MSDDKNTLTVTDNRTGQQYELPIVEGSIRAMDLRAIKVKPEDFGMLSYDPGFKNTASTRSTVTFIDGDEGILEYRGYPIEDLAENASFLEVAYLLINGELPNQPQSDEWVHDITHHTFIHENIKKFIDGFHHDAHPMGILVSTVGALSTFYPSAKEIQDPDNRRLQMIRLIAKFPTLAAFAHRHSVGMRFAYPDNDLSFAGNFLNMMSKTTELKYEPNPIIEDAMDKLFILHADHEQNCSATTMRVIGSSDADPYTAAAGAVGALYGPKHGGANEA
ncbi:MAG: citrate synthase, partial [Glaciecola sp.]